MNLEAKATQRPWRLYARDGQLDLCGFTGMDTTENYADASLIIKAVNNFDSLLEACREAKKNIPIASYSWEILRQAIANATK